MKVIKDYSFGAIPIFWNQDRTEFETLIVQTVRNKTWGPPKGHAEKGETNLEAAKREFEEETGITNYKIIEDKKLLIKYSFEENGSNYDKEVLYYLFEVTNKFVDENLLEGDIMNTAWVNPNKLSEYIKYKNLDEFLNFLKTI